VGHAPAADSPVAERYFALIFRLQGRCDQVGIRRHVWRDLRQPGGVAAGRDAVAAEAERDRLAGSQAGDRAGQLLFCESGEG
jgi:hypothetical protein